MPNSWYVLNNRMCLITRVYSISCNHYWYATHFDIYVFLYIAIAQNVAIVHPVCVFAWVCLGVCGQMGGREVEEWVSK